MRTVKFKALLKNSVKDWVTGSYLKHFKTTLRVSSDSGILENSNSNNIVHLIISDGISRVGEDVPIVMNEVLEDSICEFTGSLDCKNREIYEKDIIQLNDSIYVIQHENHGFTPRRIGKVVDGVLIETKRVAISWRLIYMNGHVIGNICTDKTMIAFGETTLTPIDINY